MSPTDSTQTTSLSCRLQNTKHLLLCFICSSKVYLEIDNRLCSRGPEDCFSTADSAAEYLGALSATDMLNFPYPLREVQGEWENLNLKQFNRIRKTHKCIH